MTEVRPWWARALAPETRQRIRPVAAPVVRNLPGRRPRWGNLKRTQPFSAHYGWDRGLPVDRVYIERFLERQRDLIVGDVLEVRQAYYTTRFGSRGVRSHVLDIDASNPAATVLGDLCDVATLPEEAYDCAILTQTLQFVADPQAALRNLWRSLRAGGALLLTVPCAARIDHELAQSDYWRWTPAGLRKLVEHCCEGALVEVEAGGNLVVAMAALLGLAAEDLSPDDVGSDDPVFPVIACVAALKL